LFKVPSVFLVFSTPESFVDNLIDFISKIGSIDTSTSASFFSTRAEVDNVFDFVVAAADDNGTIVEAAFPDTMTDGRSKREAGGDIFVRRASLETNDEVGSAAVAGAGSAVAATVVVGFVVVVVIVVVVVVVVVASGVSSNISLRANAGG
jgi:hypothetical protein